MDYSLRGGVWRPRTHGIRVGALQITGMVKRGELKSTTLQSIGQSTQRNATQPHMRWRLNATVALALLTEDDEQASDLKKLEHNQRTTLTRSSPRISLGRSCLVPNNASYTPSFKQRNAATSMRSGASTQLSVPLSTQSRDHPLFSAARVSRLPMRSIIEVPHRNASEFASTSNGHCQIFALESTAHLNIQHDRTARWKYPPYASPTLESRGPRLNAIPVRHPPWSESVENIGPRARPGARRVPQRLDTIVSPAKISDPELASHSQRLHVRLRPSWAEVRRSDGDFCSSPQPIYKSTGRIGTAYQSKIYIEHTIANLTLRRVARTSPVNPLQKSNA
ncbi:hypothetical protein C8R47DRAFT_1064672 [Mycena vitilis]|nr:hypothetical protein C8R47DRAFT_1064672 [Mycena vitilis]